MKTVDLTGHRFNALTVLRRAVSTDVKTWWQCRCDCGRLVDVRTGSLRSQKSCGCRSWRGHLKHGASLTGEYVLWQSMKQRCANPNKKHYDRYGGRGITVCDRWVNSFEDFIEDMGPRPLGGTIERKDNDGPYSPDNCCWASRRAQMENTHRKRTVTVNGTVYTVAEAARKWGIKRVTLDQRLRQGWPAEKALTTPVRGYHSTTVKPESV